MNKTKIEWALNPDGTPGYTWNPITGCLNGCTYCYARRLAETRLRHVYMADTNSDRFLTVEPHSPLNMPEPFVPRFWPEKLEELNQGYKRNKGIFVCSMSDLFGIGVPEAWTREILFEINRTWMTPFCRFYLLTKQPQNLIKFSPFPDNCWVGVSATNHTMFVEACRLLTDIKASVKYLSFEPLKGHINPTADIGLDLPDVNILKSAGIEWVIIGAQTKPTVMPKIEWVREIVEACDQAGVKVFLKDSLKPLLPVASPFYKEVNINQGKWIGGADGRFACVLMVNRLRQEMPGRTDG